MKTLILLRHGKSDWSGDVDDHDRPLNHRGRLAAVQMAEWLAGQGLRPDHMLISSATRTQETAERLRSVWGAVPQGSSGALYLADPDTILRVVGAEGQGETLLVLGHNPGLERMAVRLSRGECPPAMATCTAAVLRFAVRDWADAARGEGALLHHVSPKSLG